MAPSVQSLDPSSSLAPDPSASATETQPSSLLFSLMRPPKRPLRPVRPGDGFGVGRLGMDEPDSASKSTQTTSHNNFAILERSQNL